MNVLLVCTADGGRSLISERLLSCTIRDEITRRVDELVTELDTAGGRSAA